MRYIRCVGLLLLIALTWTSCRGFGVRVSDDRPRSRRSPRAEDPGPPPWAPAHGHRRKQRYYYFPRYNMYYDVRRESYIYFEGDGWSFTANIPLGLHVEDLEESRKVWIDFSGNEPYEKNPYHREKYGGPDDRGGPPGQRGKGNRGRGKGPPPGKGRDN